MVVSAEDVAKRPGVSLGMMSTVLHRSEGVAPAARQRVLDVERGSRTSAGVA